MQRRTSQLVLVPLVQLRRCQQGPAEAAADKILRTKASLYESKYALTRFVHSLVHDLVEIFYSLENVCTAVLIRPQ